MRVTLLVEEVFAVIQLILVVYALVYGWDVLNVKRTMGLRCPRLISLLIKLNLVFSTGVLLFFLIVAFWLFKS